MSDHFQTAPPHRDLTCTIIQGGRDSNSPESSTAAGFKAERVIIDTERGAQVGQQLAAQRVEDSSRIKGSLLGAQGRKQSHCQGTEDALRVHGHTDIYAYEHPLSLNITPQACIHCAPDGMF